MVDLVPARSAGGHVVLVEDPRGRVAPRPREAGLRANDPARAPAPAGDAAPAPEAAHGGS